MPIDPEYDQTNSLGGPSGDFGALGGSYGGGGLLGGSGAGTGGSYAHPTASTGSTPTGAPTLGSSAPDPAIQQPSTPSPTASTGALPQWNAPQAAPAAAAAPPTMTLQDSTAGGGGGGGDSIPWNAPPAAGSPSPGAGLDGGGGSGGLIGPAGGSHPVSIAFAEGGAVPDTADDPNQDNGTAGADPITAAISKAMETVDSAFQYGRQKNGLQPGGQQQAAAMPTKPGQQSDTPNTQEQPAQGTLTQNDGSDSGAIPDGDQASNDQDEDDANG